MSLPLNLEWPTPRSRLSKTRFQYGLQCLKRLYLESFHQELADPVSPSLQAIFDAGTNVGEEARRRFPNGRLVEESHLMHDQAVSATQALLAESHIPALYEAAFTFEDIRTRVDILAKNDRGGYDLIEVKSTTRVKPEHITDVGIQVYAAEGAGTPITNAYLMHLNNQYVYEGGEHDWQRLFTLADVTDRARSFAAESALADLARMRAALAQDSAPEIDIGRHCTVPYRCSFYDYCRQDAATPARPRYVGPGLASSLSEIVHPASFLDFETVNPGIPIYVGTRPYQAIPFQWSLHVREPSGRLSHTSFLNDDADDPREGFAATLLEAIPPTGDIVAYSPYEGAMLRQLAAALPHYADRLLSLSDRIVDLLKIIRDNYYTPEFGGSFSLKSVLPALAPDMSYADMPIADGLSAAASYQKMIAEDTLASERQEIKSALLAYCGQDTEAMVRIYEALLAEAASEDAANDR